jgi:hypothetical protein
MRRAPKSVGLVFYGRFQLVPDTVAIVAEAGFVAHITYLHVLNRNRTVIFHKQGCVDISPVRYVFIGFIVAVHAIFEVFTLLFRMQYGRGPPFRGAGTGQNKTDQAARQTYSQGDFFIHIILSRAINIQTESQS